MTSGWLPPSARPKSGKPYLWVTWVAAVLGGDRCTWRYWLKAHFHHDKRTDPDADSLKEWVKIHDAMVVSRAERMRRDGWDVKVEDENSLKIEGRTATVGGKPDLVARRTFDVCVEGQPTGVEKQQLLVVDAKSGKRKPGYRWQVMLYLLGLRATDPDADRLGELEYRDGQELVQDPSEEDVLRIGGAVSLISADEPPPRVPSQSECRWCDVLGCPDRFKEVNSGKTEAW